MQIDATRKGKEKGFFDVMTDSLASREGMRTVLVRPTALALDWTSYVQGELSPEWKEVNQFTKNTSKMFSVASLPEKVGKFAHSVSKFREKEFSIGLCFDVTLKAAAIPGPVCDGLRLGVETKVISVSETQWKILKVVGKVSSIVTLIQGLRFLWTEVNHIAQNRISSPELSLEERAKESQKITLSLMKLGMSVSLVALAALGLTAFFFEVVVAPWLFLCFSTLLLVLSLSSLFYEKIEQPYAD